MKYFIKQIRAFHLDEALASKLPPMRKGLVFEVAHNVAYEMYVTAIEFDINGMSLENVDKAYKDGVSIFVGNKWTVWGESISNKELFRRRIAGNVEQQVIDWSAATYDIFDESGE